MQEDDRGEHGIMARREKLAKGEGKGGGLGPVLTLS